MRIDPQAKTYAVTANVTIDGVLPGSASDFGQAIAQVRESAAGRRLRWSMRSLGDDFAFKEQQAAWVRWRTIAANALGTATAAAVGGSFVVSAAAQAKGPFSELPVAMLGELGFGAMGVAGTLWYEIASHNLDETKVRSQLEHAVTFRCSAVPIPPFVAALMPLGYGVRTKSDHLVRAEVPTQPPPRQP